MNLLATILQASGVVITAVGLSFVWFPLGILAIGVGVLLFGLALDKGGE